MAVFIVNKNPQRTVNREYEVHNLSRGCSHLPDIDNQVKLGDFLTCHSALDFVKNKNPTLTFDGCAYCCNECHTI